MQKKKKRKKTNALPKKNHLAGRIFGIGVMMCGVLGILGGVVTYIILFKHEEYANASLNNIARNERTLIAPRGIIQDRNGKPLAISLLTYDIELSPYQIHRNVKAEKQMELYQQLSTVTEYSAEQIKANVDQLIAENPDNQWYQLAQKVKLTEEQYETIRQLGGVTLVKNYMRHYPNGELAAHVLGFYSKDGKGQYGIEQGYEEYLIGEPGRIFYQVHNENITTKEQIEPVQGATIKLSLDQVIQEYVEDTMEKYIKEFGPSKASCIIMEPNTGAVLAMYSYPSVNPNTYNDLSEQLGSNVWVSMQSEEQAQALNVAWKNYGIQLNYESGSTFKPLVVAMALQEGSIKSTDTYECSGYKKVKDRTIYCAKRSGHGHQTLSEALANSCNVAMMDIAEKMDNQVFQKYLLEYGFGETTGIELAGEESGILHSGQFEAVEKATSSIGQTFNVTPIQLITAFSSVINGGYLMKPYIVSEVIGEEGETLLKHEYTQKRQVLSTNIADSVRDTLRKVVDEGTGQKASIPGYHIGGKTGTAQKFNSNGERIEDLYTVSFVGFAPVENPEVIALILFDDLPEYTGAPTNAFKDMMTDIFPYMGIESDNDEVAEGEELITVPSVTGKTLYEAAKSLGELGVEYEIKGSGLMIREQFPAANTIWGRDGTITLYTTTDLPGELVEVPNLLGKTIEEAREMVGSGWKLEVKGQGTIHYQLPYAGYKIEKGNKIIVQATS